MVYLYTVFNIFVMICIAIMALFIPEKNKKLVKEMKRAMFPLIFICLFSVVWQMTENHFIRMVIKSFYYTFIVWSVVGYTYVIILYTGFTKFEWIMKPIYGLAFLDSIMFMLNPWTGWGFKGAYSIIDGVMVMGLGETGPVMYFHLVFTYCLVSFLVTLLLIKCANEPTVYLLRYINLVIISLATLIYHYYSVISGQTLDYTNFLYCLVGAIVGYYELFPTPEAVSHRITKLLAKTYQTAIVAYDKAGRIVFVNKKAKEIFSGDDAESFFENYYHEKIENKNLDELEQNIWEERLTTYGKERIYRVTLQRILDNKERFVGVYLNLLDFTEEYEAYLEEKFKATHDSLTKLYNRQYFYEKTSELIRSNPDKSYMMVCCDIKEFKLFNDLFGMEAGNRVLKRLAYLLSAIVNKGAVYGRLQADIFAVCMPKERYYEAIFLDCIRDIEKSAESKTYKLYIQMGVYEIVDPYMSIAVICDRALLAINAIKDSYTEQIAYYGDDLLDGAIEEQWVVSQFQEALDTNQFQIFLQPQMDSNEVLIGCEALARWVHPVRGIISPALFVTVLERTSLIYKLDMKIWELACKTLRRWIDRGIDKYISVNISSKDFFYVDLYDTFIELTANYSIPRDRLRLEITESAFMNDAPAQIAKLDQLKEAGFIIEMDDFGSGYSSLNMLKDMNVDVLKIDMGFLSKGNTDNAKKIIRYIIQMAHELDMEVITEGVEDREQFETLTGFSCNFYQGYYFDKPLPVAEFENKYL